MSRLFPPEVLAFFKENNYGKSAAEMTVLLNRTFDTCYTVQQIKSCRSRNHWDSGLTGRFEKGHTPANKGKKVGSYPGMVATQFKPGRMPHNHRPVGSERITRDGYLERKVAEPKTWRSVHVLNWEQVHGPVPEGHALIFKDGDRTNCEVDNLLLVTRGELAIMNKRGLCKSNPETTQAGLTLAKYIKATHTKKKERKRSK